MRKTIQEKIFADFANTPLTGECLMNVPMVIKLWQDNWYIVQHHDEYRLCEGKKFKTTISKSQALEIIRSLVLLASQCTIFNYGLTWMTVSAQQERVEKLKEAYRRKI